ncbi:cytochrome P450 [Micromonospora echinofusca]|uniref:Cytochrome P450 n=1 Tax=Micromonospora echinofusca TaxID=47858 RepID=A0ABS3VTX7_MICEH|nr:cytochrome P450 [Micromonospora echinofusca]MBO4207898.1 cytochrome P450 [Micromonospora echinofusca]
MTLATAVPWPPAHPPHRLFGIAPDYIELSRQAPLVRLSLASGAEVWLATRYQDVRTVLSDRRFSSCTRPLHRTGRQGEVTVAKLVHSDPPEHTRYRSLINRAFSARRMIALEPRIHQLTEEYLDAMATGPRPTDLIQAFAHPLPVRVICELLGVSYADQSVFLQPITHLLSNDVSGHEAKESFAGLLDWMSALLAEKRAGDSDDLLSELARCSDLPDGELADLAITLLAGGYESTTGMIAASVAVLDAYPEARLALRSGAADWDRAIEELLRYITVIHHGLDRVVTEDVFLGGQILRRGERVIAFLPAANHDLELCADSERLDVMRSPVRHASFGFGPHQCVGQQLARSEIRIALSGLMRRFPNLQLAVDPEELRYRSNMVVDGLRELPVTF